MTKKIVSGDAYTGGKLRISGWKYPVVIDISTFDLPDEKIPLVEAHQNKISARLGKVNAYSEGNKIRYKGEIFENSDAGKIMLAQAGEKDGDWQTSVGADIFAATLKKTGVHYVNNQAHQAPFIHAKKGRLREISVLPIGADENAFLTLSAGFNLDGDENFEDIFGIEKKEKKEKKEKHMDGKEEIKKIQAKSEPVIPPIVQEKVPEKIDVDQIRAAAITEEKERCQGITLLCTQHQKSEIAKQAIEAGWTLDATRKSILENIHASMPDVKNIIVKNPISKKDMPMALSAGMCLKAGFSGDGLIKDFGEKNVEIADRKHFSMKDVFIECARIEGIEHTNDWDSVIQAGFTTLALPHIFNNVANKTTMQAFDLQRPIAPLLCSKGSPGDFKQTQKTRLESIGSMKIVPPNGEIKEDEAGEEYATNQLATYGKTFSLDRVHIINDDLDHFLQYPRSMGMSSALLVDELFFQRLMGNPTMNDGNALFHADHNNYLTGADTALSKDALQDLIALAERMTNLGGQELALEIKVLLVPTTLKWTAVELTKSMKLIATGGDATASTGAILNGDLNAIALEGIRPQSSSYLEKTSYTGNSEKAYYGFCDKNRVETFEIAYLNGKEKPTTMTGKLTRNRLGMWFTVIFDVNVKEQGWRGVYKMKGEV